MSISAMKQALEALDAYSWEQVDAARFALRQAIAEAEKPAHTDHPSRHWDRTCPACVYESDISQERVDETAKDRHEPVEYLTPVSWYGDQPLYAKPICTAPSKREWVGLTDEEVHDAFNFVEFVKQISFDRDRPEWCKNFAAYLEAKLKEKNT